MICFKLVAIYGTLVVFFASRQLHLFPLYYYPIIGLDCFYFLLTVLRLQQLCQLVVLASYFAINSLTEHILTLNQTLYDAIQNVKMVIHKQRANVSGVSRNLELVTAHSNLASILKHFITEHTAISVKIARANSELWANLTFGSEVIHVPNNAYMLCRLVLGSDDKNNINEKSSNFEHLYLNYTILLTEAILLVIPLLLVARAHALIHQCKRKLPTVQWLLLSRQKHSLGPATSLHLQTMLLYERLTGGPKVGVSIGPFDVVTNVVFCQLIAIYLVYVLSIIKMFH